MKNIEFRNFTYPFAILSVILIMYFLGANFDNTLPDIDVFIGVSTILVVLWGEQHKLFHSLWIRMILIVTIAIYTFSVFMSYFFEVGYLRLLQSLSILTLLILITIVALKKLFRSQVSGDVQLLNWQSNRIISKLNNRFDIDEFKELLEKIMKWSANNLNQTKNKNDIKTVVELYRKINNLIIINHYFIGKEKLEIDTILELLRESYDSFYTISINSHLDIYSSDLIVEMIGHFYSNENYQFLKYYLSIMQSLIEIDFSISSKTNEGIRHGRNTSKLFEFVVSNYVRDNKTNSLIIESIDDSILKFRKYSFDLSDKVTIFVLQEYVNSVLHMSRHGYNLLDIRNMRNLIGNLHSECIPRRLELFYNTRLTLIMNSNKTQVVERMSLIYRIIDANKFDKSILNLIVEKMERIITEDNNIQYFKEYLVLLSTLSFEEKKYHSLKPIIDHSIQLMDKEMIEFIESTVVVLLMKKDNIQYVFEELIDYVDENNVEEFTEVVELIIKNIYYKDISMENIPFLRLFGKTMSSLIKKFYDNEIKLTQSFNKLLDSLDLFRGSSDSIEVDKMIIALLDDYLDQKSITKTVMNYLMNTAFVAIESSNHEIYNKVSNSLGWYLFKLISKRELKNGANEISSIKYVLKNYLSFYKEIHEFSPQDSIFVGTVIVVNAAKIESLILDSKNLEDKNYFNEIKKLLLNEIKSKLNETHLNDIEKSFRIRKFSIDRYIDCKSKNTKEIVNDVFNELKIVHR